MLADVWGSGRRGPSRPRLVSGWFERSENRDGARSAEGLLRPLPQTLPILIIKAYEKIALSYRSGGTHGAAGQR